MFLVQRHCIQSLLDLPHGESIANEHLLSPKRMLHSHSRDGVLALSDQNGQRGILRLHRQIFILQKGPHRRRRRGPLAKSKPQFTDSGQIGPHLGSWTGQEEGCECLQSTLYRLAKHTP